MKTAVYKIVFLAAFIVAAVLVARHFGLMVVGTTPFYLMMGVIGVAAGVGLRTIFGKAPP